MMFTSVEEYNQALLSHLQWQLDRLAETAHILNETESGKIIAGNQIFMLPPDEKYITAYQKRRDSLEKHGKGFPFDNLQRLFRLSQFEAHGLLMAYAGASNPVTLGFALNVFKTHTPLRIQADFIRGLDDKLFRFFLEPDSHGTSLHSLLKPQKRILAYIAGAAAPRKPYLKLYRSGRPSALPYKSCDMDKLINFVGKNAGKIIYLYGEAGTGKKTAVKCFADETGKNILFIDMDWLKNIPSPDIWKEIEYFIRECLLENAYPCFYNTDSLRKMSEYGLFVKDLLTLVLRNAETVFIIQQDYSPYEIDGTKQASFPVRMPDRTERAALWSGLIDKNASFLANSFALSPKHIEEAAGEARLVSNSGTDEKTLSRCCYHQTLSRLTETADKIPVSYGWEDLIVSPEIKKTLMEACNHVKYSDVVLEKWGLKQRAGYGVGVNILLAGPPGTGKTMAAQVVANELNMDLYRIDTSKIVSKYIGETEKRLKTVFDEGQKSNVVLFFDEMDSLFGFRTEIKDSHDKYANMQTSYILQRIEDYEGVVLLATNLLKNIDEAFMRRIQYVLYLTIPNAEYRYALWKNMLPPKAPVDAGVDFEYLAENYEIAGGIIKNIVLSSAFYAASENKPISMKHIMTALQIELSKQGKILIKEDLGEYSRFFVSV